ncbi:hypothetical protein JXA88_06995 [Candidatus Fermentibacteria bacterium]|nr:hypothetical protein [Candidatus Fermentibacteria bacterium]
MICAVVAMGLMATVWEMSDILPESAASRFAAPCADTTESGRESCVKEDILVELGRNGFFEARFETTAAEGVRTLRLVPGRRYTVARIVVDGASSDAADAVLRLQDLAGSPWEAGVVTARLSTLLGAHEEAGFPFVSLGVRHVDVDSSAGMVTLRVGATAGPRSVIERIEVSDSVRTRASVVSKLAGIRPGMPYRQSGMDRAVARLRETGYYSSVGEPVLLRGIDPGGVVVRFPLVERVTHTARGAVGLARDGAVVGSVQAAFRNIAGTAREASFRWEARGAGRTDLALTYREPWILGLPPSLEIGINQVVEDTLWVERDGTVALGWDLGGSFRGYIGYRGRRVIPGEGAPLASTRADEAWGKGIWNREHGDDVPPTGSWVSLRVGYQELREIASEIVTPVVRVEVDVRRSLGLGSGILAVLRGAARHAVHGGQELPLPERFSVGGARTVRGYREAQFRTESAGWIVMELHRVSRGASSLFAFVDCGVYQVGERHEGLLGVGMGIMARTTVGMIELAYGVPRGSDPLQGRVHIALGRGF